MEQTTCQTRDHAASKTNISKYRYTYDIYIYMPGTQMTSIFEGTQPPKTRPKLQPKQGAPFGFQMYIYRYLRKKSEAFTVLAFPHHNPAKAFTCLATRRRSAQLLRTVVEELEGKMGPQHSRNTTKHMSKSVIKWNELTQAPYKWPKINGKLN